MFDSIFLEVNMAAIFNIQNGALKVQSFQLPVDKYAIFEAGNPMVLVSN